MNAEMTARKKPLPGSLGVASHSANRASIFYPRIRAHASLTGGHSAVALAFVMAHEIGHVLLSEDSHAPSGLMRANWQGMLGRVPGFMPSQAATLRTVLTLQ